VVVLKWTVNELSGFASNTRLSEGLPAISFGKSGGITWPVWQRSPTYPVFSQSQENSRELMITHFPPWRQGLGLQRPISERKEHKNMKISQRMNKWLKEERKEISKRHSVTQSRTFEALST